MANLETLELTIQANADSASQGLNNLINSLTALSKKIGSSVGGLMRLNAELEKLQGYSNLQLPDLAKSFDASGAGKVKKAADEIKEAVNIPTTKLDALEMKLAEVEKAMDAAAAKGNALSVATKRLQMFSLNKQIAKERNIMVPEVETIPDQMMEVESTATRVEKSATKSMQNVSKETEKAAESGKKSSGKMSKAFDKVSKMFSSMIMRTAIRSLIKGFSEAWTAAYTFSHKMGGEFAASIDKVKTLLSGTAINIISAFAPAIQALVPILSAVASAVNYLCNAIRSLFSLLGMSSDLWGASTDAIGKYVGASNSAGSATKEALASFDELNVITSGSGGGGGGGGGSAFSGFSDIISSEFNAITQLLVSEGLIALGLILACAGHIGIGVGLIAVGAAGIVKTFMEDYEKLPNEIQRTLTAIAAIAGASSLALGVILLCTGHIGAGLGLILAGGLNLAAAVIPNWKYIVTAVETVFNNIETVLNAVWEAIKKTAQQAWDAVCAIWENSGIGELVRKAWGTLSTFFKGLWEDIGAAAHNAWTIVSRWWHENVTKNVEKEGIWGGVKGFFKGLWEIVSRAASEAWDRIMIWWNSGIGGYVEAAWEAVKSWFSSMWEKIKELAVNAWGYVEDWWDSGIGGWVSAAWGYVQTYFGQIWTAIENSVQNAWNIVKNWWNNGIGGWISAAWGYVQTYLGQIWEAIKRPIVDAWNFVKNWWITNVYDKISAAWENVKKIFEPIWNILKEIWDFIQKISGKTIKTTVETTVRTVQETVNVVKNATTKGTTENNLANIVLESAKESSGIMGWAANLLSPLFKAEGAYGIPSGDLFIANEAGAELVGSMNGKTTVANQGQIIEGIQRGVAEANEEQNRLLREQNGLLRGILEKDSSVRINASAALGRVTRQSLDMYSGMTGG